MQNPCASVRVCCRLPGNDTCYGKMFFLGKSFDDGERAKSSVDKPCKFRAYVDAWLKRHYGTKEKTVEHPVAEEPQIEEGLSPSQFLARRRNG